MPIGFKRLKAIRGNSVTSNRKNNFFSGKMQHIDIFGQRVTLSLDGFNDEINTTFGGIMTVVLIFLFIIYLGLQVSTFLFLFGIYLVYVDDGKKQLYLYYFECL